MRECLLKIRKWLVMLAEDCEKKGKDTRFMSLAQANIADAKNYRKVILDIDKALAQGKQEGKDVQH